MNKFNTLPIWKMNKFKRRRYLVEGKLGAMKDDCEKFVAAQESRGHDADVVALRNRERKLEVEEAMHWRQRSIVRLARDFSL
jgi:hypothetical protein